MRRAAVLLGSRTLRAGQAVDRLSTSTAGYCALIAANARAVQGNLADPPPATLEWDRPIEVPREEVQKSWLGRALLRISGFYSKESKLLRGSKNLFRAISEQAGNPQLYQEIGLQKRFANEHAMLCLHMWMLLVRMRTEGDDGRAIAQMVYEDLQHDVELRVRAEGVKVRISKWLTELEQMFYGMSFAFDKALRGEEDFTEALLRNVYAKDESKRRDAEKLHCYIKRELACLRKTGSIPLMEGRIKFSSLDAQQ